MSFEFSFEKLLKHKKMVEELAHRDWLAARAKVEEAEAKLKGMYDDIDQARQRTAALGAEGGRHAPEMGSIDVFINGQKIRIMNFRSSMRQLVTEAEMLHEALIEAAKERKTLEKLRERQFAEYKLKAKKRELKQMDEIVVTRFKR